MASKLYACVFFLSLYGSELRSQGQITNLEKYWHYRDRLTAEFMVVGGQQGMSQAAANIFPEIKRMNWSDNAVLHGWYIGMLALEYHLLANAAYQGFDKGDTNALNRTLSELQHALAALLRFDDTAEIAFPPPCDSLGKIRNGFFIRDDVPRSFYAHFPGIDSIQSESTSTTNVYNSEMSQDQVYHLLFGLSLVKKYIPASVVVNGMNLRQEAVDEAKLIVEWVNKDGWVIKNPACLNKNVARGADASLLSHGLNEAIKFISDGTANYDSDVTAFYTLIWSTLASPSNPGYSNIDNLHMAMALAAIGNGWGDTTLNALMNLAEANRWYAYPLLWVALYENRTVPGFPGFLDTMNAWSEFMLDEAPADGPRNSYPDTSEHGYAVFNRFLRAWDLQYIGNPFNEGALFNGLDYMMLHNLYYTVSPFKWIATGEHEKEKPHLKLEVYPNPSSGWLYLKKPFFQNGKFKMKIFDSVGKEIHESNIINAGLREININQFSPGFYFFLLTDEQGKQMSGNFLKSAE